MLLRVHRFFQLIACCLAACLLAGCVQATPPPAPPPPAEILARVVVKMRSLNSFGFVIVRTGAPAYFDADQTLSFSRLEGSFNAPDQAQGQARIIAPGVVASLKFISIGPQYWETNYLTGEWWQCPPDWACFNPRVLFDPQVGLQPILQTDLGSLETLASGELEELPGKTLYQIGGRMTSARLSQLSLGLIGSGPMQVRLWVDPVSDVIHRIRLDQPTASGEVTTWTVDFLNFDKPVAIQKPALK